MPNYKKTHKGQIIDVDLIKMKWELEHKKQSSVNKKTSTLKNEQLEKIDEMVANRELIKQKINQQKMKKAEDEEDPATATNKSVHSTRRIIKK